MYIDITNDIHDTDFLKDFSESLDGCTKLCFAKILDNEMTQYSDTVYVGLWFTTVDMSLQWGDDWDDKPYDEAAGIPYDTHIREDGGHEGHIVYTLTLPANRDTLLMPCDYANRSLSACELNSNRAAWLYFRETDGRCDGISVSAKERVSEVLAKFAEAKKRHR